jgi:hypothetical protein
MLIITNYGRPRRLGQARPLPRKEVAVTVDFSTQRTALQSTGAQNFLQPQPVFTILNSVRNVRQTY